MRMTSSEYERLVGRSSCTPQSVPLEVTTHQGSGLSLDIPRFVPSLATSPARSKAAGSRKQNQASTAASPLEEEFARQLMAQTHESMRPSWVREYRFNAKRRWRFDFAWPDQKVAVEIEGGIWSGGRHTRGAGFLGDCDKYNAAQLAGWLVLRFAAPHLQDGTAIEYTREALGINHDKAGESCLVGG